MAVMMHGSESRPAELLLPRRRIAGPPATVVGEIGRIYLPVNSGAGENLLAVAGDGNRAVLAAPGRGELRGLDLQTGQVLQTLKAPAPSKSHTDATGDLPMLFADVILPRSLSLSCRASWIQVIRPSHVTKLARIFQFILIPTPCPP